MDRRQISDGTPAQVGSRTFPTPVYILEGKAFAKQTDLSGRSGAIPATVAQSPGPHRRRRRLTFDFGQTASQLFKHPGHIFLEIRRAFPAGTPRCRAYSWNSPVKAGLAWCQSAT